MGTCSSIYCGPTRAAALLAPRAAFMYHYVLLHVCITTLTGIVCIYNMYVLLPLHVFLICMYYYPYMYL